MKKTRVLLVDDYFLVRRGLRALLMAQPDMDVVGEARNGKQAIEKTAKLFPDIILMGVTMPVMNGINATCEITKRFPSVKVLALTACKDKKTVQAMIKAGAAGYLVKASDAANSVAYAIRQ